VACAKNTLPRLIDLAQQGEEVIITRYGKPVAEIRPADALSEASVNIYLWMQVRRRARSGVELTSVEILDQLYENNTR